MIEIHISAVLHNKISVTGKNLAKDKWELTEGADIQKALEVLNMDRIPVFLMLNGHQGNRKNLLKDGDILKIFPVLAGG